MRLFNAFVSSTKALITSTKRIPPPVQKVFVSSTINAFISYLEGALENPQKGTETREKSFCKTPFQLRVDLKKDRNNAEMKEYRKTTRHLLCVFAAVG